MATRLRIQDLKPGMVLAEDLTNEDGAIVLPAGKVIDESDIQRLSAASKVVFAVVDGDSVLVDILKEKTKDIPEEIVKQVEEAFKYWEQNSELYDELRLIALKYRFLLQGLSTEE